LSTQNIYTVALRGPSWVAIEKGDLLTIESKCSFGPLVMDFRTRYDEAYSTPVPRELLVDVRGNAPSIREAIEAFWNAARGAAAPLALTANAAVGELDFDVAYDATPDLAERDFFQNFVAFESGFPKRSRRIRSLYPASVYNAVEAHQDADRIARAAEQYRHALLQWSRGRETFSMSHLWMGVEALTPAVLHRYYRCQNLTRDTLIEAWRIELKQLDSEVRRRLIFRMDDDAYKSAKTASDSFEHGFGDFQQILQKAASARNDTARYLRQAIFDLICLNEDSSRILLEEPFAKPLDPASPAHYFKGVLIGLPDKLAAEGQAHPRMIWKGPVVKDISLDGGKYQVVVDNNMTALLGPGVTLRPGKYEAWGP